jgi:hypothetical protein
VLHSRSGWNVKRDPAALLGDAGDVRYQILTQIAKRVMIASASVTFNVISFLRSTQFNSILLICYREVSRPRGIVTRSFNAILRNIPQYAFK